MTNFCELREKISDWTADDEDIVNNLILFNEIISIIISYV
jgi:hypothetical protein